MTAGEIALQVRSLRAQLDVLESHLRKQPEKRHTLADLRGLLAGAPDSTDAEIDGALYRSREGDGA